MRALKQWIHISLLISLLLLTSAAKWGHEGIWGRMEKLQWGRGKVSSSPFSPKDIIWSHYFAADEGVEGDSSGTPADSGNVVFFWQDQTSNSNDAFQGTNSNRPIFQSGVHNGNYGLLFDSNDDYLTVPGDDTERECTFVMVVSATEGASTSNSLFGHNTSLENVGMFQFGTGSSREQLYLNSYGLLLYKNWNYRSESDDGNVHIWEVYLAGADGGDVANSLLRVDGNLCSVYNQADQGAPYAWNNLMIGRAGDTLYGGFTLSEFAVKPGSLTEVERKNLQNYWADKYGITL